MTNSAAAALFVICNWTHLEIVAVGLSVLWRVDVNKDPVKGKGIKEQQPSIGSEDFFLGLTSNSYGAIAVGVWLGGQ